MRNIPETVHEYNIPRLNIWFIVSSILLILCVAWMIYDDYMREWKPYQREAKKFEMQKLREDAVLAQKKEEESGLASVTNKIAEAAAFIKKHKTQLDAFSNQYQRVKTDFSVQHDRYMAAKALLDQRKSEYNEGVERHKPEKEIEERLRTLHQQEAAVLEQDLKAQALGTQKKGLEDDIQKLVGEKENSEKELKRLETGKMLVEKRMAYLQNRNLLLLDAPLVEFAQPTVRVKQVIVDDQTYSVNFADVARIDRCDSCHMFIDKKETPGAEEGSLKFVNLPQPFRSHPRLDLFVGPDSPHPMERFGCSTCHLGWDRGTGFVSAAHTPSFKDQKVDCVKIPLVEGVSHWIPVADVEKWKPGLAAKAKEHADLVAQREKLKSSGGSDLQKLAEVRVSIQKLREEMKDQFGFSGEELLRFKFASLTQEEAWRDAPLHWRHMPHKEDPMRPAEFIESSCLKCHRNVANIPEVKDPTGEATEMPGEKINAGLRLVEQAGCFACHKIRQFETVVKYKVRKGDTLESIAHFEGSDPKAILAYTPIAATAFKEGLELDVPVRVPYSKPGPSLLKISSKTSKEWMLKWLESPKGFRPNTFMPQFWNLDNNKNEAAYHGVLGKSGQVETSPAALKWADRNAVEIHAITDFVFSKSKDESYPAPPPGDAARGQGLVNSVGCMGCHVVDQKLEDLDPKDRRFRSQGPMLFGAGSKYNAGWLYAWLKDPAQYRHDTRMPNLRLSDQEAADITAFLMSSHHDDFEKRTPPAVNPAVLKDTYVDYLRNDMSLEEAVKKAEGTPDEEKLTWLGNKLVQRYGCMDCHNIDGMEGAKPISIELSEWGSKSPEKLDYGFMEIPHDNYSFLRQKLKAPRSFDYAATKSPQELLRMPQFNFTDEQVDLIMTAIMGMTDEKPTAKARRNLTEEEWNIENGRWLIKELNCMGCHINEQRGGAIRRTMDEDSPQFYPPSLDGAGIKIRPAWLQAFLRNPGAHRYRHWLTARMPTFNFTDDQINTLTRYFALRDKQPYPFEADTSADAGKKPSKESIAMGEQIFLKAGCLACHGPVPTPSKAPNLNEVKYRMRPKGIIAWLKNPQNANNPAVVTPDKDLAMPQFWPDDQPNPLPDFLGGDREKQIQAVADYLGVYSAPPPTFASSPSKPAISPAPPPVPAAK